MKKYEKIYKKLRKEMTDEEIADSMLIPQDMTEEEQRKSNEEIKAFRFKLLRERTEEQRIYSDLLRFKFLLENYINKEPFSEEKSFGKNIEEYVRILNRTKKSLSEDLDVHYTRLSRLINDREEPNIELMYRLEKHSGNLIPAIYWWKLVAKKQEHIIKQDLRTRKKEGAKVKNAIEYRA
ncbi:MAG: plasmid maintenance system antidote protein VapI [Saprospiraceae bacterium]|jgi:plasmid maintenance system antidote protein VapI